jgi:protocatechuate 3,4-dioxygenase, alpha subunit
MSKLPVTPSQTIGPFFAIALPWPDGPFVVHEGARDAITVSGRVTDGAGDPVPDALIEIWQADGHGTFNGHPNDPRITGGTAGFRGFGRCATDGEGGYRFVTVKPGALPCGDGGTEAPHLDVSVFARGLLDRLVTRIYFPDEEGANAADPVLGSIAVRRRRDTLLATATAPGEFRFDIRLQGDGETVFFDV